MKYSVYEAKARLSEVIKMVKSRRRVIITERGVPVAEVIPYIEGRTEPLASRIQKLSKSGVILPPKAAFQPEPVTIRAGAVRRFLQQDRD